MSDNDPAETDRSDSGGEPAAVDTGALRIVLELLSWDAARYPAKWVEERRQEARRLVAAINAREAGESAGWLSIESVPDGEQVLLWWDDGEKGRGGMETAMIFRDPIMPGRFSFWTHGGPNSGSDWEPRNGEMPTRWMPLPPPPESAR